MAAPIAARRRCRRAALRAPVRLARDRGVTEELRLHRGRRRLGRLRARRAPQRRPGDARAAARSRAARSLDLDPPADRLRQDDVEPALQLVLLDRPRSEHERPPDLLAARQDARRLELDQRPDLHPRPARGLRPLGRARQHRLGLRRRAAVLHRVGRQPARRERVPRRRRTAARLRHRREARADRGLHRRRRRDRRAAHRRLQRRAPGRRRLLPAQHLEGLALQHREGLSRAGAPARPTCASRPRRRRPACCSTDGVRSACASASAARRRPRAAAPRCCWRPARCSRRSCCSSPASARRRCSTATASASSTTLPGVGENLQDHLQIRLIYECTRPITTNDELNSLLGKIKIGLQWLLFRTGPLAIGINQAGCFMQALRDADGRAVAATPDIQFHVATLSAEMAGGTVAPVLRLHAVGLPAAPGVARPRADPLDRSVRAARDAAELPVDRARSPDHGGRDEGGARDRRRRRRCGRT